MLLCCVIRTFTAFVVPVGYAIGLLDFSTPLLVIVEFVAVLLVSWSGLAPPSKKIGMIIIILM